MQVIIMWISIFVCCPHSVPRPIYSYPGDINVIQYLIDIAPSVLMVMRRSLDLHKVHALTLLHLDGVPTTQLVTHLFNRDHNNNLIQKDLVLGVLLRGIRLTLLDGLQLHQKEIIHRFGWFSGCEDLIQCILRYTFVDTLLFQLLHPQQLLNILLRCDSMSLRTNHHRWFRFKSGWGFSRNQNTQFWCVLGVLFI